MALLNRISQLFTADFHALLDRIEDPETLLKQAVREMEEALADQHQAAERLAGRRHAQELEAERVERRLEELNRHIDHAFAAADDGLARQLLRQRLLAERQQTLLEERAMRARAAQGRLRDRLADNQAALDSMRQKLAALELTAETGAGRGADIDTVTDQEVDAAFLAEQARRRAS